VREAEIDVANRLGLHARAAARFVELAGRFRSRVTVACAERVADGKSILGLLTLAAPRGARIRLCAEGEDEARAVEELVALVRDRFGEDA
jgi:phosphocarrier protein